MAGLADKINRHRQAALVLAHRRQVGWFTDNAVAPQFTAVVGNQACTLHRGFFVGRGHQRERTFEFAEIDAGAGRQRQCQETLHVATAESVNSILGLVCAERITGPQLRITGYGIGVARQHQAVTTAARARDQVRLALIDHLNFDIETETGTPLGNLVNDAAITHVDVSVHAADRRRTDEFSDHLAGAGELRVHAALPLSRRAGR